jgi:hypothetical protein
MKYQVQNDNKLDKFLFIRSQTLINDKLENKNKKNISKT